MLKLNGFFLLGLFLFWWVLMDYLLKGAIFKIVSFDGREPVQKPNQNFKRIIGLKNPEV